LGGITGTGERIGYQVDVFGETNATDEIFNGAGMTPASQQPTSVVMLHQAQGGRIARSNLISMCLSPSRVATAPSGLKEPAKPKMRFPPSLETTWAIFSILVHFSELPKEAGGCSMPLFPSLQEIC
jgi:hypothetical protein